MGSRGSTSLRVGCVKYLNARPLIHGWPGVVELDEPAALCRKLAAGGLDLALVSSFEFLRNPVYAIVDDVAIAADGPVYSVFVASRRNVAALEEISLDPASATSANLLRCLLAERKLAPRLISQPNETSGRLLIGDQAIRFRREHACDLEFWDLGAEWKQLTGLPFVFALWLIGPEYADAGQVADQLRTCRDRNLAALDELISEQSNFSPEFCASYFRHYLRFRFGEREKEGLRLFRSLCEKHGILPRRKFELRLV